MTRDDKAKRSFGPWAIAIGLGLGVSANLTMVAIAVHHRSAPVPGDPDLDGPRHDEVIAKRRASLALGWSVAIDGCATDSLGACDLALRVVDRAGAPVDGLHGRLIARRADTVAYDREVELAPRDAGRYGAIVQPGAPGAYRVTVELEGEAGAWSDTLDVYIADGSRREDAR